MNANTLNFQTAFQMATLKIEKKYERKTNATKQAGRPKKPVSERKAFGYNFKLTASENEVFVRKFKSSGKKDMTSFMLHLFLYENLPVQTEDVSLQKLLPLLNKIINEVNFIGNNLNQITKLAHQYSMAKGVHLPTLERALAEEAKLHTMRETMQSIFHQIGQKWL